jgi:hypothetical protein
MATYYWVGGSGTWSGTGNTQFAITSGGVATLLNPTSADTVIFDSASGAGTCTTGTGAICSAATFNTSTITLSLGGNLSVSNTFNLTSGTINLISYTLTTGGFSSSNSNTRSVDFGTGKIVLTTSGSIWVCSTLTNCTFIGSKNVELTYSGASNVSINAGNTAGGSESTAVNFTVTAGSYLLSISNSSSIGSLIFTGFIGTLSNNTRTIYGDLTLVSGMTLNAGANAITFRKTSGTQQITTAGKTIDFPLIFNGIGSTFAFQDALTQGSTRAFTITNGTVQLKNGVTSTVGGFATSGTTQKILESTLAGSQATLSQASGTVNASYLTIKDINATGGATWNAYVTNNNINAGNNVGWDFYLPVNSIYDSLRLRGYTGTVTDMLLQYYKANGATSNSLQDAESEFLILKGFTFGSNTDKWFAYLRSLSFTGTVTDMLFNYWKDPA